MSQNLRSSLGFDQRKKYHSNQGLPSDSLKQPSFLSLKNNSEFLERSPEFQVSTTKNKSRNLDDSQEISKRLSQLRLSLGLSDTKIKRKKSDENSPLNRSGDFQDAIPEARELSKYLTEYSNQKHQKAVGREFATTFGNRATDFDLSPGDDVNQGSMIVKSRIDNYDDINTSFKKKGNYMASEMGMTSHFNSEQIEALLTPDSKSRETDLLLIEDPRERFEKLAYHFQNENELLRQRIEEEQSFYKQQMTVLSTRLDEYKRSLNFEKQSESLLKENTHFYKNQIEELEKMINELNGQLEESKNNEKELQEALNKEREEFKNKEESYSKQIKSIQQDLEIRRTTLTSALKTSFDGFDPSFTKDQYVRQLETDIKFLKSLTDDLNNRKTQAEERVEQLERDLKNISTKVGREIEKKFKQEIEEKTFMIDSLRRENDTLLKLSKGNLDGSRVHTEPQADKKEHSRKSKNKDDFKGNSLEDIIVNLELKINELENNNFALHEKNMWLDTQLQAALNKKETKIASDALVQTNEVYERRCKTLTDAVLFWKDKSFRLTSDFFKAFQELREENDKMKQKLMHEVARFEGEVFDSVKKIKGQYKKENSKILDVIEELEEKHHQNQAKLAEARSKYKNLALSAHTKSDDPKEGKKKKKLLM